MTFRKSPQHAPAERNTYELTPRAATPQPRSTLRSAYRLLCLALLLSFALSAQNGSNNIIQNPGNTYNADVAQLESDSVQAFLAAHNLPSTDAPLLYQYGRRDLRDELRAWIFSNLQSIISTQASARTPHEQNLYNWFEALVYKNEVAEYQAAVAEYKTFESNKCGYQLNSTIAAAYNMSYDGSVFCIFNGIVDLFLAQPIPGPQYFLLVGLQNSYNSALNSDVNAPTILGETETYNVLNEAYAIVPGAAAATVTGILYATSNLAPYAFRGFVAGADSIPAITDALDIGLTSAGEAGGAFGIVTIAAAIGVQGGLQNQTVTDNLAGLEVMNAYYTSLVQNCNSIDLNTFLSDSTGVGLYKLLTTFVATTLPDVPSTTPLPTRTEGVDPIWGNNVPNSATYDSIAYTDWNNNGWVASVWGNYILQTRADGSGVTSFGVTLKVASDGGLCFEGYAPNTSGTNCSTQLFSASRIGPSWVIAPQTPATIAQTCPVNPATGISPPGSSLTTCTSYLSNDLTFRPNIFTQAISNWSVIEPPVFSTNGTIRFLDGMPQSIVLKAYESNSSYAGQDGAYQLSGALPPHFSSAATPSGLTVSYDGTPGASLPGVYDLTASAQFGYNGSGQAPSVTGTVPVALIVKPGDGIQVRSDTLTAYVGDTVNYQIQAPGPSPIIQLVGVTLPPGLSFTQRGSAATISGAATAPGSSSGTIQTNYGATEPLTVNVTYRQSPAFTSPNTWTFTENTLSQFRVVVAPANQPGPPPAIYASSAPFPQGFESSAATLAAAAQPFTNAPWLQFRGGYGHALLLGTPPSGTGTVVVYLASVFPNNSLPAFQTLTISSNDQPVVTGPDVIVAPTPVVSTGNNSVTVVTVPLTNIDLTNLTVLSSVFTSFDGNQLSLTVPNSQVGGLFQVYTYLTAAGTSCPIPGLSTPAAQAVSTKAFTATRAQSAPANTGSNLIPFHTFNIEIDQPASITSAATTYFSEGVANSFAIVTTGFPEATTVPNSTSSATAMRVKLTGALPTGVTFTDLSPGGLPTGTGLLSGTPTQTGTFPVTVVASNGVGTPASQEFTLVVNKAGDVNGDGVVNCTDIGIVKAAFGSYQGGATFDPRADLNHDFKVNVLDLSFVAAHLPAGTRCQ